MLHSLWPPYFQFYVLLLANAFLLGANVMIMIRTQKNLNKGKAVLRGLNALLAEVNQANNELASWADKQ